jgi:hypothetical protein
LGTLKGARVVFNKKDPKKNKKNQKKKESSPPKNEKKDPAQGQDLFFLVLFLGSFLFCRGDSEGTSLCKFERNIFYFFFSTLTPTIIIEY